MANGSARRPWSPMTIANTLLRSTIYSGCTHYPLEVSEIHWLLLSGNTRGLYGTHNSIVMPQSPSACMEDEFTHRDCGNRLLFLNDLADGFAKLGFSIKLYADDAKLYSTFKVGNYSPALDEALEYISIDRNMSSTDCQQ